MRPLLVHRGNSFLCNKIVMFFFLLFKKMFSSLKVRIDTRLSIIYTVKEIKLEKNSLLHG